MSAAYEVPHTLQENIPIGWPIPNTQIYILNVHHQPQPLGIPGELCIAGTGLARGYLNRPDLTAKKFPEVELFGQRRRIYKTGDLARWLPDGNLEYLGRLDHQVKLRGFRIELGEIEATLTQYEAVKEAVVVLRDRDTHPNLAAYLTLAIPLADVTTTLRTWLSTRLPDYMIPASVTVLEKLPLTPNGKIDRQALPVPDLTLSSAHVAPHTETERLLLNLWSQVLGLEVTSIQTNFFEAGGHSLLATQLVSRIRDIFHVEMSLRVLFDRPQLQSQADWLESQQRHLQLPPLTALPDGTPPVLSFAQQRLWFLAQLEGATATYNMPSALRLIGYLQEAALQRTVITLVERHESLRLCFPTVDGQMTVQRLANYNPLSVTDLRQLPPGEQANQVTRWIHQHATTPFDLSTGPLFRLQLLQLGDTEHLLLFNMHHLISDGWSMGILIREWSVLYQAYGHAHEPHLPVLPIQYTDYAAWQRQWLTGEVLEAQLVYWRAQLAGAPALLELPTDFPRPAVNHYLGSHLTRTLNAELTRSLTQFSRQQGVTLFMTLLATFQVLLSRYSGQTDIVVGSPIANRTHQQTEYVIGFFVNTLVLRTQVQGELTFVQLLKTVRDTTLGAYSHQDLPFEYLVEQLNPPRSLSYSPLCQVMFVLQNTPPAKLELGELQVSILETESTTAKFDLTLNITETGETLRCDWEYSTELFRRETIERLTEHFQILLTGLLQSPEQTVAFLPWLTEAETQQLLAWNQTHIDYPQDQTIVDLFQAQVEKTPENIAVVFEEQQLTYRELNTKANQLAHYLITVGVTTETLVGIAMERSPAMVGLLGILKAGGAYVPLDPAYPQERLRFMLEDSQVPLLLSQGHLLGRVPASSATVVLLDWEWERIATGSIENPEKQSGPSNLAYVIYTSGSTGKPKGVMIEHRNLTNLVNWHQQQFAVTDLDKATLLAGVAFDASTWELWPYLSKGACVYPVAADTVTATGTVLTHWFNQAQITITFLPTPLLETLLTDNWQPQTLRSVLTGGEALHTYLPQTSLFKLYNNYGPTENTVVTTCGPVSKLDLTFTKSTEFPAIGSPIANTQIYILDPHHQPTPPGIPGELCIAGAGLARGYLNRPDLTAEKFFEVKLFGQQTRIYKTGDLARWLPDGNLEYLGRRDHQVKLRGFRIELGEIEATLTQHEAVKEAVVILRNRETRHHLAAYLTLATPLMDVTKELRTWLSTRLPDYMIPASITVLEKLPLTPNGKIDRQALPTPTVLPIKSYVAPRDYLELQLVQLWEKLLNVRPVSITDNFFELGGHSLLAVNLMSQIQNRFSQRLLLSALFQSPSIALLAGKLRSKTTIPSDHPPLVAIQPHGQNTPLFCLPGAWGQVLYFHALASHLGTEQPVFGLEPPGLDGHSSLPSSVEAHAWLLLTHLQSQQPHGPYYLAGHSAGSNVAFELARQLEQLGEQVAQLIIFDTTLTSEPKRLTELAGLSELDWLWQLIQAIAAGEAQTLGLSYATLAALADDTARWQLVAERLHHGNILSLGAGVEHLKQMTVVYQTANWNHFRYQPTGKVQAPVVLFRAQEPPSAEWQDVNYHCADWGWQDHTEADVTVIWVPGNHHTMFNSPQVQILAAHLQKRLPQPLV